NGDLARTRTLPLSVRIGKVAVAQTATVLDMLGRRRRWARLIANGVIPTIRIGHEQQRYAVTRSGLEQSSRSQFRRTIRKAAHRQHGHPRQRIQAKRPAAEARLA